MHTRAPLSATLAAVYGGESESDMPEWAQRASGEPRMRRSDSLIRALADARAPTDVLHVLLDGRHSLDTTGSTLPKPALQLIDQIRSRTQQLDATEASEVTGRGTARGRNRSSGGRGPTRSSARVVRGFVGLRGRSARSTDGTGDDKVMKLAKRLQGLIHLAESRRDEARKQVRMAEASSAAQSEGQGGSGEGASQGDDQVSIDALIQEVLAAVNREIELRKERRQEDPEGRHGWW